MNQSHLQPTSTYFKMLFAFQFMPALSFSNGLCFLCPYNAFEKFTRETIRIQIFGSTEIHLGCIRKQEEENKPMISQTVLLNWWSKSHMATVIVYSTFFWDNVFSQWQQWGSSFPFLNKMLKKKKPHSNVNSSKRHLWGVNAGEAQTQTASHALTTRKIPWGSRTTHT